MFILFQVTKMFFKVLVNDCSLIVRGYSKIKLFNSVLKSIIYFLNDYGVHSNQQILACAFNHALNHNTAKTHVYFNDLRHRITADSPHRRCNIWRPAAAWPATGLERGYSHPHTPGLSWPAWRRKTGRWTLRWRWRACRNLERSRAAWRIPSVPPSTALYTLTTSFLQNTVMVAMNYHYQLSPSTADVYEVVKNRKKPKPNWFLWWTLN